MKHLRSSSPQIPLEDSKMTDRYSQLSPDHLRESVNLLNTLPSGKEMVNIFPLNSMKAGAGTGI
jgi:hypothetical protein